MSKGVNGQRQGEAGGQETYQGLLHQSGGGKQAHLVSNSGMNRRAMVFLMEHWQGLGLDVCAAEGGPLYQRSLHLSASAEAIFPVSPTTVCLVFTSWAWRVNPLFSPCVERAKHLQFLLPCRKIIRFSLPVLRVLREFQIRT